MGGVHPGVPYLVAIWFVGGGFECVRGAAAWLSIERHAWQWLTTLVRAGPTGVVAVGPRLHVRPALWDAISTPCWDGQLVHLCSLPCMGVHPGVPSLVAIWFFGGGFVCVR